MPATRGVDIIAHLHHDATMRTTIDLPPDLHSVLTSLAMANRKSLSQTAVELLHRGLEAPARGAAAQAGPHSVSAVTGLPQVRFARPVSAADVRALEDEA
jgi:hypothetical protein